jgi:hypothetical protein
LFGVKTKPGILSHGADIAIDLFSKKYLFKRSNWLVTLAGSYLLRSVSQIFLNRRKTSNPIWTKGKSTDLLTREGSGNGQRYSGNSEMPNQ